VEVQAEATVVHLGAQVAVGRGHDAHIDLDLVAAAHATEATPLQRAQQVRCQLGRQLAYLVEEERAAVGAFEGALVLPVGSGEGAALMAEEFRGHEVRRQGGAVDGHEGLARAWTEVVQEPRDELLPRPALAAISTSTWVMAARRTCAISRRMAWLRPRRSSSLSSEWRATSLVVLVEI